MPKARWLQSIKFLCASIASFVATILLSAIASLPVGVAAAFGTIAYMEMQSGRQTDISTAATGLAGIMVGLLCQVIAMFIAAAILLPKINRYLDQKMKLS